MTDGMLLREAMSDPMLENYQVFISALWFHTTGNFKLLAVLCIKCFVSFSVDHSS